MNHLGVLLHDETLVLVLHGSHVGVDRWDGRDHLAKLQLILPAVGNALSRLLLALLFSPAVRSFSLWLLFSPAVGPLFRTLVTWIIRSSITVKFSESADSSSVLLRAVHHALRDVLVCRTLLYVLRVVCWIGRHHCSLPPRAAREVV